MPHVASFCCFLLILLALAPAASASEQETIAAESEPAPAGAADELLAEAESLLLKDPPRALALCARAVEKLPPGSSVRWRGEEVSPEELASLVETLTDTYAATADRLSFASYCLDHLIGPDRVGLAMELARRLVREGKVDTAFSLAEKEELLGPLRVPVLLSAADHFQAAGETDRLQETLDESLRIYTASGSWAQDQLRTDLVERLFEGGRREDVVALSHGFKDWRQPFYLSVVAELFPNWKTATLLDQALGLAQQQESAGKTEALARLAAAFAADDQTGRAESLLESARAAANKASGRDRVRAFAALAESAANRNSEKEAAAHIVSAIQALLDDIGGWRQTDALNELARNLTGTAAAPVAGPWIEKTAVLLAGTVGEAPTRNKYRAYEFLGIAATMSPAGEYTNKGRLALFANLVRLDAMPDEEEMAE